MSRAATSPRRPRPERLGYAAIWLPGGQLDDLRRLADLVQATTAVPVGASIISPDVYAAEAVSGLYGRLAASAPGRLIPGLGGPQQPRSLAALNSFLDQLDQAEPPVRRPAAAGRARPAQARAGPGPLRRGHRAAGHAWPTLRAARRILGAQAALVVDQMLVLDTDAERARETARRPLRFLSGLPGYRASFARMGFTEQDIAEVSDRLTDELVIWGDADTVAARVGQLRQRRRRPCHPARAERGQPARPDRGSPESSAGWPASAAADEFPLRQTSSAAEGRTHGTAGCALRDHRDRPGPAPELLRRAVRLGVRHQRAGRGGGVRAGQLRLREPQHDPGRDRDPGRRRRRPGLPQPGAVLCRRAQRRGRLAAG